MKVFHYRHDPTLSQSFINGSYELGEVKQTTIAGREILYRVGSATLDNSCCGNYGCGFGLVIGEKLEETRGAEIPVSKVRQISLDDHDADVIRETLMKNEALGVMNFYTAAEDAI